MRACVKFCLRCCWLAAPPQIPDPPNKTRIPSTSRSGIRSFARVWRWPRFAQLVSADAQSDQRPPFGSCWFPPIAAATDDDDDVVIINTRTHIYKHTHRTHITTNIVQYCSVCGLQSIRFRCLSNQWPTGDKQAVGHPHQTSAFECFAYTATRRRRRRPERRRCVKSIIIGDSISFTSRSAQRMPTVIGGLSSSP